MPGIHRFRDIVAVGASAGGTEALLELVAGLPAELPATLVVVQHTAPTSSGLLPAILSRGGQLPATAAVDGEAIERGQIYVASPGHHLLLGDDRLRVTRGPRENGHRPAVDPLFRSAARRYGRRVVAVVLSGMLDDGTAGLIAVKARGGVAVVQEPGDAIYPGMPENAIAGDHPDYVVPSSELADLLCTLVQEPLEPPASDGAAARRLDKDELTAPEPSELRDDDATLAPITCPECGGPLFEHDAGHGPSFNCLVGHRYSISSLDHEQARHLEATLWTAVRSLYERAELLRRLGRQRSQDAPRLAQRYEARARSYSEQAEAVVAAILRLGSGLEQGAEAAAPGRGQDGA